MEIRKGEKIKIEPTSLFDPNEEKSGPRKDKSVWGTVLETYPKHGMALLDFGTFRECFSFYGSRGLHAAMERFGVRK